MTLAVQMLDDSALRPGCVIRVSPAEFQVPASASAQAEKKKKKQGKVPNKGKGRPKRKSQWDRALGWEEYDEILRPKKVATVVIIKNMFHPREFDDDAMYITEIKDDLQSECSTFGTVKRIQVFDVRAHSASSAGPPPAPLTLVYRRASCQRHPDGVVSVKFGEREEAQACVARLHGRFFNKRQLLATIWDGETKYDIEETDLVRRARFGAHCLPLAAHCWHGRNGTNGFASGRRILPMTKCSAE